ncbi:LuxR family transcriptional regulator [Arthrobacter sp. I2-34]|uniref:LuxR family transcriptional regulator n=1 Tax=Arthrobacter hankyongi TaxID=2904801 RepID=A0ABS9L1Z4_9MICC|nr:LuxR family transcriptional regulator [Arthrobacter hankyongi]MCG2620527.1 LuxR family transcriptional regulator [Arthrobacter hankyongi]
MDELQPHTTLIGRQEQFRTIVDALGDPRHCGAIVAAPAGMGKTALLGAVMAAEAARFRFIPVAAGAAAGMDVPYAALTPMLARLPLGGEPLALDVLRTVLEFADADAGRRPVIVVDDADELDDGSASVIAQLAASGKVRTLASVRPGHSRGGELAAMAREGILRRVELKPLTPEEQDEFCRGALESPVLPAGIRLLGQASGGSPQRLALLLQEARRARCLVQRNGAWVLLGEPPEDSQALQDAARLELSPLDEAARSALLALALMGPARRDVVEQFLAPDVIDALAAAGYLDPGPADAGEPLLQLAPSLHPESLRRLAPVALKRRMHQWFTTRAAAAGLPQRQRLLAVRWALECGNPVAPEQLLAAAEEANACFRPGAALLAASAPGSAQAGPAAAVELARAGMYQGRFLAARASVLPVLDTADAPETVAAAAEIAVQLALLQGQGRAALEELADRWQAALSRLRGQAPAGTAVDGTGPELLRLQARSAGGRPADTLAELEQLVRGCTDLRLQLQALVLLAEIQSAAGLGAQCTATAARALDLLEGGSGPAPQAQLRIRLARQLLRTGELDAAERQLGVLESTMPEAMLVFGGTVDFLRAWLALKQGHVHRALEQLAVAVEGLRQYDPEQLLPYALGWAASAAALAEDRHASGRYLEEFAGLPHQGPPETSLLAQAYIESASALFESASAAVDRLADIARMLAAAGRPAAELEVRMLMVRLGDKAGLDEMIRCAGTMEGPEAKIYADFARAARARCGKQSLAAAARAADAGYLMLAAEAAAQSVRQFAADANHKLAREAGKFLQNLRRQWPGTDGLRLVDAPAGRQLTHRERDVAVMAASGTRAREIAERLGVSVRTVEGHIYRIYEKLDIRSREELAASFGQDTAAERHQVAPR